MKFNGIPQELEAVVEALLATAVADAVKVHEARFIAAVDPKEPDSDDMPPAFLKKVKKATSELTSPLETKVTELTTEVARLKPFEAKATELTAALELLKTQHTEVTAKLEAGDAAKRLADTIADLKANYHLTDAQIKEEKRQPLIAKLAAGKEPMTLADWNALISGAQVVAGGGQKVPLFAGAGGAVGDTPVPDAATKEAIARNFPAAVRKAFR